MTVLIINRFVRHLMQKPNRMLLVCDMKNYIFGGQCWKIFMLDKQVE